jgi:hypothetical protein
MSIYGAGTLTDADVAQFVTSGAVALREAFPRELADECRSILWHETGCDEHDASTWTRPVIRLDARADPPFRAAANTPRLVAAYDQLAGVGRWSPLAGLGTFPIRFPSAEDPSDAGWHIEATGTGADGRMVVDPASRERVLLLLFLFSDVGPDDAPTRVRLGSHMPAARELRRRDDPVDFIDVAAKLAEQTAALPQALATGSAGDVWLCHPYVVHAAQPHRGREVRFMAQPPLPGTAPLDPSRPAGERSPVEQAIHRALAAWPPTRPRRSSA